MVDVIELRGWILNEDAYRQVPRDGYEGEFLIQDGIRRGKVYVCGYCEEGWHEKREDAENCCKEMQS